MVNVLSKGVVYVYSKDAIALGDAVTYHWVQLYIDGSYRVASARPLLLAKPSVAAGARWLSAVPLVVSLSWVDIPGLAVTADT